MDIVIAGDTHERHREVEIPDGDLFLHCGDFSMFSRCESVIKDFDDWLGELPHRWKVVIPGNHDVALKLGKDGRSRISNATLLINEKVTIDGLKIFGSPVTPQSGGAFSMTSSTDRATHWQRIPNDVNVLITHGPPYGVLDRSPDQSAHMGDPELLARLKDLESLRLHCFGHVHSGFGRIEKDGVLFVNAALMGAHGDVDRSPVTLRIRPVG